MATGIVDYKVMEAANTADLASAVKTELVGGWTPYMGVVVTKEDAALKYSQAMVKNGTLPVVAEE